MNKAQVEKFFVNSKKHRDSINLASDEAPINEKTIQTMLGITPEEVGKLYSQALQVMKSALSLETGGWIERETDEENH